MYEISKKTKVLTALALAGMFGAVALVHFTKICNLHAVTINGETTKEWTKKTPLEKDRSILRQPFGQFIESSFANEQTLKLDYRYSWPHTLNIEINSINPDCLLLDQNSSTVYGLDRIGRVLPLESERIDWERPVLTGAGVRKIYDFPTDIRVREVVRALDELRSERINFYRLIEQIDFASEDYLEIRIAGSPLIVRLRADFFHEDINRYIEFVARFRPDLKGIKVIDLRQNGQIVTRGNKA